MKKIRPIFKIHGGKYYLCSWILEHFPKGHEKMDYIEPFCGAASVFLNKSAVEGGAKEIINDVDHGAIQVFRALRDEPDAFIKRIKRIEYNEKSFDRAKKKLDANEYKDYMEEAITEYVVRRMSRGGLKRAFAWSNRARGGQPGDVNAWKTMLGHLKMIAGRIQDVHLFNKNGIEVIEAFDSDNAMCYADPPYLKETRTSKDSYQHEMTDDDHIRLATVLNKFKGKVAISGYPSTLYRRLYKEWNCHKRQVPNHASQQKKKQVKTEVVWTNY